MSFLSHPRGRAGPGAASAAGDMGAVSETEPAAVAAAASASMAIGRRCAAIGRVCVRALFWLEKIGWVVVGKTGEGRERDVGVGGDGRGDVLPGAGDEKTGGYMGRRRRRVCDGLPPLSFCFLATRSLALLVYKATAMQQRASSLAGQRY